MNTNYNKIINHAAELFEQAAKAWEHGNNSGNPDTLAKYEAKCDSIRNVAEAILEPIGVTVDYPGLYPVYSYEGHEYYSADSLIHWMQHETAAA